MCGIAGILNIKAQTKELRDKALKMLRGLVCRLVKRARGSYLK